MTWPSGRVRVPGLLAFPSFNSPSYWMPLAEAYTPLPSCLPPLISPSYPPFSCGRQVKTQGNFQRIAEARGACQAFFAAQVKAMIAQIKPAPVSDTVERDITIVRGVDQRCASRFIALHCNFLRAASEMAAVTDFSGVAVI